MKSELSRLENWTYLLSKEVVNYWLSQQQSELPPIQEALSILGVMGENNGNKLFQALEQGEDDVTWWQELEKLLQRIQEHYVSEADSLEKLWRIEAVLFNWYYGDTNDKSSASCSQKLRLKSQTLRIETQEKFPEFINSVWLQSSPKIGLDYLSRIEAFLFNFHDKYEAERERYFLQENGGKKSYNFFISEIMKSPNPEKVKNNYQLGIKALFHIYKCKIKAEISDSIIQIIRGIIQDNQLVINNLIQSSSFLDNLKESFSVQESKTNLVGAMLFEHICSVKSPESLKQELEHHLGVPLNKWGSSGYICVEEVRRILLDKVAVVTKDAYIQLAQEFNSNAETNKQENNHFQEIGITN